MDLCIFKYIIGKLPQKITAHFDSVMFIIPTHQGNVNRRAALLMKNLQTPNLQSVNKKYIENFRKI